jgi:protein-S-isoprenylcysteine O-methyltransferase Ste14
LFRNGWPPLWGAIVGIVLLVLEGWIFWRVKHDLGMSRLIGKTELSGGGKVVREGMYAWIRHPRYVGSFIAIVGACFIGGTRAMWIVVAVWCIMALGAIALEERELLSRFGADYEEYCRRVPRFLPASVKLRER